MTLINSFNKCFTLILSLLGLMSFAVASHAGVESTQTLVSAQKCGLLVLSHGSPASSWNKLVENLVAKIATLNAEKKTFHAVEGAYLEFATPCAADGIEKLEAAGCDHIIVAPLFIAPSSHSHFDVPAVLGLYSSPSIRETLASENARIARPKVPVTMIQTLNEGTLLDTFARDAFKAISTDPSNEALVVLAHGCPDHHNIVDKTVRRIATYCCGQIGIDYADWAYCGVGQTFWDSAAGAIMQAADSRKRVLVVGLYVSSSADTIVKMARKMRGMKEGDKDPFAGKDIVFSKTSVIEHPTTAQYVLDTAASALKK
ncbi:hypothetical protein GX645_00330 [Candidatus Sumerlaeota bacterium]|nr:hypothetical protein [Candidatus Sumerlaeota bacterium]